MLSATAASQITSMRILPDGPHAASRSPPAPRPLQPLSAVLNEAPERPGLPMPRAEDENTPERQRIADAKRLALENPAAVATIVKGWVNGEAAA